MRCPVSPTSYASKLMRDRPANLAQAARIDGMTPAAISLLLTALRRAELARQGDDRAERSRHEGIGCHRRLPLPVSRETKERLESFAALFEKWARSINLVAPSTLSDFGARHIRDSAQIFQLHPHPDRWVDLGSGGGFPGIITAILLHETSGGWVHLIESNNKKAAFLRTAMAETGARASVHPIRIETAPNDGAAVRRHLRAGAGGSVSTLLEFSRPG